MTTTQVQASFSAGELDPKLKLRGDVGVYYNGASKLRNVFPIPQGGVTRRPGLEYIDFEVPPDPVRMIPFVFSDTEHYLCIISTEKFYVLKEDKVVATVDKHFERNEIREMTWDQLNDVLIVCHEQFSPRAFIRYSETNWGVKDWEINNPPTQAESLEASGTEITIKIPGVPPEPDTDLDFSEWVAGSTATVLIVASGATFDPDDVNRFIRTTVGGYAKIIQYKTSTEVIAIVLSAFTNEVSSGKALTRSGDWWFENYSWTYARGYPRSCAFHQGRLYFAGTKFQPTTVWGSIVNNEHNFQNWLPEYADNGLALVVRGTQTPIHRLYSGANLLIATSEGLFFTNTGIEGGPITPSGTSIDKALGADGMEPGLDPFEVSGTIMYMRPGGKSLMEAGLISGLGSYEFRNLNLLSPHLLNSPVDMAFRRQTSTNEADYVLVVNGDGTLAVLCTDRSQEINAWAVCETQGKFLHAAVDGYEMYFIVKRYIDGQAKRYLEKFNTDLHVDSGVINPGTPLTYNGTPLTYDLFDLYYSGNNQDTIRGVEHLRGEPVKVILDGNIQNDKLITGSTITLDREGKEVQVGLNFPVVDAETGARVFVEGMPIEIERGDGTTIGSNKRLLEVTAITYNTAHLTINKNSTAIRRLDIDKLDSPIQNTSKSISVKGLLGWDKEIKVSVGQTLPLPFTLLGMAYKVKT